MAREGADTPLASHDCDVLLIGPWPETLEGLEGTSRD